jgi:hypothetical protein
MNGSTCQKTPRSRPDAEPTTQKRYSSSTSMSRSTIACVSEISSADTAVPARTSETGSGPPRVEPMANTATEARPAPRSENHT